MAQLVIRGARGTENELKILIPPSELYEGLPENPLLTNVALIYKRIAADIRHNTKTAPSFDDAVTLYEILNKIEQEA